MNTPWSAAVIVSTYRNRLLCDFADYRAFLNYMVGADLFLHDVAVARRAVAAHLEVALPTLKDTSPPPDKSDNGSAARYARKVSKELGWESTPLAPMTEDGFTPRTVAEAYNW